MNRRQFIQLGAGASLAAATSFSCSKPGETWQNGTSPWPLCLNSSTIRPAGLKEKIDVAAKAGFDGIELWVNELEKYEAEGGDLKTLGAEIRDRGLFVPNIIGLWDCMPMEEDAWQNSLAATRNRMRMSAWVGAKHAAAIPAPDRADFDLKIGTDRYRELLRIGREEFGLIPAFEFVGFFKGVYRLGQAAAIALDADDPDACLVMDTFHLFRGGSGFNGVRLLHGKMIANFHWNDVLTEPPREEQGDKHRVYPGDGVLPLVQVLKDLKAIDYHGPLSLELFHPEHWQQDPLQVAKTGLEKMRSLIAKADAD
jgi:sugar phosphate isomerase/epimerase